MPEAPYTAEAAGLEAFLDNPEHHLHLGESGLAAAIGQALDAYGERLRARDVPPHAIGPARLAYAVRLDLTIRSLKGIRKDAWLAAAHSHLYGRRDVTPDTLQGFLATAEEQGGAYKGLAFFLRETLGRIEGQRQERDELSRRPVIYILGGVLGLVVALWLYAGWLDYAYHRDVTRLYETEVAGLPAAPSRQRLALLREATERVGHASDQAPLRRILRIPYWDSGSHAEALYGAEVARLLPQAIRSEIGAALATEGENLALYDMLRAWAVLTGRSEWAPAFLAGWLETREDARSLARHVERLAGPDPTLAAPDDELLEQARGFAAETPEVERAFLEMERLEPMRALPSWAPQGAIRGLDDILVLRSGRTLSDGVRGIHTRRGWELARASAAATAVQVARSEASRIFDRPVARSRDAEGAVLARLQDRTLAAWRSWLEDLRVKPFTDQKSAIIISGALARDNSPLEHLLRAVWREVGGEDRTRPHEQQLRIAAEFGPAIQYVERGEVKALADLFASLNVALATIEISGEKGADRLMDIRQAASFVRALDAAPALVVQIVEAVLAQTSTAHASLLENPLTRQWQSQVFEVCSRAVSGRYPFGDGADADPGDVAAFFGPGGTLRQFVARHAGTLLDTEAETWRWTPEARLSGVGQESAAFLQRSMTIASALFSDALLPSQAFEITALAERGQATVALGGTAVAVRASGETQKLVWPGASPQSGMEVTFRAGGESVRVAREGVWGMLRLLDETSIRFRDDGQRQLVDLKTRGGRLFFEMAFDGPVNPVSARSLFSGLTCPAVL